MCHRHIPFLCQRISHKKRRFLVRRISLSMRKRGDSNPRYGNPYVSLANWWFQPLTHPSFKTLKRSVVCQTQCKVTTFSHSSQANRDFFLQTPYILPFCKAQCHVEMVKSGIFTICPHPFADCRVKSAKQLHSAAS